MLADQNILRDMSPVHIVGWGSHRLKRPTPSAMHAEALALSEGTKVGEFVRAALCEVLFHDFPSLPWETVCERVTNVWASDSKGTYDV